MSDYDNGYYEGYQAGREFAQARIEGLEAERDEALNQLDSARHSVAVLEKRVAFVENERRKTFQALLKVTKIHEEVEAKLAKAVEELQRLGFDFESVIGREIVGVGEDRG